MCFCKFGFFCSTFSCKIHSYCYMWYSLLDEFYCMSMPKLIIWSAFDEYLGSFLLLSITSRADMNVLICLPRCISLDMHRGVELLGFVFFGNRSSLQ